MTGYFGDIAPVAYEGPDTDAELAFRHYNPDEVVMGKRLEDHLRFALAWWHSFAWPGNDPFGGQTFERPWFGDTMELARLKADVAFDLFGLLGQPFFCFHDADIRPEGDDFRETTRNLEAMVDYLGEKMEGGGPRLLWGTANLFTHRRFMAGAATNPDPDVFAYSAATVKSCMDATHKLGGENYVLWGGREGYETLLNTDLARERRQAGRFLQMVVDYKHKIGFKGAILVEPKPQEPSKHQYDYDVATVYGFLKDFGLEGEVKMNVEQGHAILAGHSGWDTDQFPNNVPEVALAYYEVLKAGGFTTGGTNFDAKLRRQSLDPVDLIAAHVGAMDVCAAGLKAAARMLEDGRLETLREARYAGWDRPEAQAMLNSGDLGSMFDHVVSNGVQPVPVSGRQERLENLVNSLLRT